MRLIFVTFSFIAVTSFQFFIADCTYGDEPTAPKSPALNSQNASESLDDCYITALTEIIGRHRKREESVFVSRGYHAQSKEWQPLNESILKTLRSDGINCLALTKWTKDKPEPIFCAVLVKFDSENGEAEFEVFRFVGKLDAGGYRIHLRRTEGKWVISKRFNWWVS